MQRQLELGEHPICEVTWGYRWPNGLPGEARLALGSRSVGLARPTNKTGWVMPAHLLHQRSKHGLIKTRVVLIRPKGKRAHRTPPLKKSILRPSSLQAISYMAIISLFHPHICRSCWSKSILGSSNILPPYVGPAHRAEAVAHERPTPVGPQLRF